MMDFMKVNNNFCNIKQHQQYEGHFLIKWFVLKQRSAFKTSYDRGWEVIIWKKNALRTGKKVAYRKSKGCSVGQV